MAKTPQDVAAQEKLAGLVLIGAAALALILANSPMAEAYEKLLKFKFGPEWPRFGVFSVEYWVVDGLMAVFFLLVGLEVKREWFEGRLSSPRERRLPIIAAIGGMAIPALVFVAVTGGDPASINGWAIPAATDIAFAIGVIAILGRYAPASIKLLLVTIAIVDDIGAVIIIALFYTADLNTYALGGALAVMGMMAVMAMYGVRRLLWYIIGFVVLWYLVLASGVHATIAGVMAALTIPLGSGEKKSPLRQLEHDIHPWVMFGIVPIFGFVAAGVALPDNIDALFQPLPLGIMLGLFVGKQIGVYGAIYGAVKMRLATRPRGTRWAQIYGAAMLCGIGFTMSLFIGGLAFPGQPELVDAAKIGTLAGSLLSALAGYAVLRFTPPLPSRSDDLERAGDLFGEDRE
ncbi:Na+/H+ antiporter NhaA [Sphingomicrobium astaxanthinifaciens]|uniref:Na+/H+ antiporter NhaA n=1 Tax=Sphingomicrobium astaxanthinifaciens TaxID=1227949 RepID=UPI001FCAB6CC|nr:Na+/H+ antiporter NhaA [Sphingomicrobium astaxanthinifaciens]MCJ7421370.1 Na+/H+ antiporter NhaA [Sphingomicrobium astaxanthinifaciens]